MMRHHLKGADTMIGRSLPTMEMNVYLARLAGTDSTVLITGETGTGKELAAQIIHRKSPRHTNAMVCINCTALPETLVESELFGYERGAFTGATAATAGRLEMARGGTVFLDEIGDMNPLAQTKILRTTENKEVYRLVYRARLLGHKFRFGLFCTVATWTASDGLPLAPFSAAQVA